MTEFPFADAELPFVSVVMPAFNEARHIPAAFAALAAQTYPHDRFEVLLVDNGSTDDTAALALSFADRIDVRVLQSTAGSIAAVRNGGAAAARGEVLAFLDCDCFVPPDWIAQAVRLGAPDLLWGAHYRVPADGTWVGTIWAGFQAEQTTGPTSFLPAGCLFVYKEAFERVGGFQAQLETSEDVELSQRARAHGMRVEAFTPLAVDHAGTPRTLRRFYLQNRWHGKHVLRMFLRNLPQLNHLPLVLLSLYMLLMFWATVLGAALALLYRSPALFAVPLVLLLLPAALLALLKTVPRGRIGAAPQLFALYTTYLLARAAALLQPPARSHR